MASNIKYGEVNGIEYSISVFERPEMESPVYRICIPERVSTGFFQRIETNSYPEWHEVRKVNGVWETMGSLSFLGFTKQEAIEYILR